MKEALIELLGVLGIIGISLLLICTVIIIIQLIFNRESRNDLVNLFNSVVVLFKKVKLKLLVALLHFIRKAVIKIERGMKNASVS